MPVPEIPAKIIKTSIPKIQSDDWIINQFQNNVIKAFNQLQDQVVQAIDNLQKQIDQI